VRQWVHLAEGQAGNTLLKSDGQMHGVRMWGRQRAASTGTGVLVHDGNLMQRPIFIPPTCQLCQNSALGRQKLDPRLVRPRRKYVPVSVHDRSDADVPSSSPGSTHLLL
jgi:hypothetical protein